MPYKSVSHANTSAFTVASPQAGVSSERVRLVGGALVAANTVTLQFQSNTGSTALSGAMTLIAGTPFVLPASPAAPGGGQRPGYLQSAAGDSLQFVLGGNTQVSGFLEYITFSE